MKKVLLSILSLAFLISCEQNKTTAPLSMGNLTISEAMPELGSTVNITYQASDSLGLKPEAIVHFINQDKNRPEDLPLIKEGNLYKAQIKIPDSTTAVAFNFKMDGNYDANNEKGYILPLYDENGTEMPGSKMSAAWFRLTEGPQFGYGLKVDSVFAILENDYKKDPELKEKWQMILINIAGQVDKQKASTLIEDRLAVLNKTDSLSETELGDLMRIYSLKKDQKSADSIQKMAIQKYPKGLLAIREYIDKMQNAKDLEAQKAILDAYEKNIGTPGFEKDYLLNTVANGYYEKADYDTFSKYAEMEQEKTNIASLYNNLAWESAQDDENIEFAETISKRSLALLDQAMNDPNAKPDYYTESQFKEQLEGSKKMYSDTYAYILFKQGKTKEALNYQEKAIGEKKNPDVNERYIQYLMATKDYAKTKTEAEDVIKNNTSTPKIKEYLAAAYKETNTKSTDFDTYLAALEKTGDEKALMELKKSMIDEAAPQFKLMNLDGKEVALADLKGKTVVLDFWATWCGPCKMSFPGMQMALNKYEDDPNVEFLFVDTWESTAGNERKNSVSDFIKKNKYSFNVLMDTPVEEGSNEYSVVSDYKVDGIPTKFILGPDGRIKFKAVGFDGSSEKLAQEIEMMIDLAKS